MFQALLDVVLVQIFKGFLKRLLWIVRLLKLLLELRIRIVSQVPACLRSTVPIVCAQTQWCAMCQ